MSTSTLHRLAADYLHRLRDAASRLPRERRRELLADIEDHLAQSLAPNATDAEALTVLDRLGQPEEIIQAEQPQQTALRGPREWAAILLLLLGGLLAGIGWILGVILLWSSHAWNTRDKLIGTLILPGGLLTALLFVISAGGSVGECTSTNNAPEHCTSGGGNTLQTAIAIILLLAPLTTSIYLTLRARHHPI